APWAGPGPHRWSGRPGAVHACAPGAAVQDAGVSAYRSVSCPDRRGERDRYRSGGVRSCTGRPPQKPVVRAPLARRVRPRALRPHVIDLSCLPDRFPVAPCGTSVLMVTNGGAFHANADRDRCVVFLVPRSVIRWAQGAQAAFFPPSSTAVLRRQTPLPKNGGR